MPESSPSLSSLWQELPSGPGVYIFKDEREKIIYIGKAKNLINRVKSYFIPPTRLGPKTQQLVSHINTIEYIEVFSEIEALLLESKLIRKFKPFYNLISKDDKSPFYIHITPERFPRPVINHVPARSLAGPFLNRTIPSKILRILRRITPFCTAPRPVKKPCLYSHLGLCNPCPGAVSSNEAYNKNIIHLSFMLKGKFSKVRTRLNKDMLIFSNNLEYENALLYKERLLSLDNLLSSPVSANEFIQNPNLKQDLALEATQTLIQILKPYIPEIPILNRIEMYDIAHLHGTSSTGAMVVADHGIISKNNYRHFTVKTSSSQNDPAMLAEIINRRLKNNWPVPDLIVLDGGKPQISSVISSVKGLPSPVISLAKKNEAIILFQNHVYVEIHLKTNNPALKLLQNLRDEAHRFSRRLHHLHRKQSLLD